MYVLRKSFGPWSAGTRVESINDGTEFYIGELAISEEYVVERRPRTAQVPVLNSRERTRRAKRAMRSMRGL